MVQVGSLCHAPRGYPAELPARNQWLHKLRDKEKALYLKHESHSERFIAYDTEVGMRVPVKIRGGPDEYTLQNLTGRKLRDVAVIAPSDAGYRVGWLDELPTAAPEKTDEDIGAEKKKEEAKKKEDAKKSTGQKAEAALLRGRGESQGQGEEEGRGRTAAAAGGGRREHQGTR